MKLDSGACTTGAAAVIRVDDGGSVLVLFLHKIFAKEEDDGTPEIDVMNNIAFARADMNMNSYDQLSDE